MKILITSITEITPNWMNRVNGLVCVNGTKLTRVSRFEASLGFVDGDHLDASEVAMFVRNFYEEGFTEKVTIT